MTFDINVTQEEHRTRVSLQGQATLSQLLSLLQVLDVDSATWPSREVLFDLGGLQTAMTAAEQARFHDEAGRLMPRMNVITVRWN
jgi:hypothetical protein